jgi:hypothetical protein
MSHLGRGRANGYPPFTAVEHAGLEGSHMRDSPDARGVLHRPWPAERGGEPGKVARARDRVRACRCLSGCVPTRRQQVGTHPRCRQEKEACPARAADMVRPGHSPSRGRAARVVRLRPAAVTPAPDAWQQARARRPTPSSRGRSLALALRSASQPQLAAWRTG